MHVTLIAHYQLMKKLKHAPARNALRPRTVHPHGRNNRGMHNMGDNVLFFSHCRCIRASTQGSEEQQ